uniref:Cyclin-dependent kinase 2-interacting protein n=1 Tax=Cacopsylla melanoneura TaxID=428564 RepID=A0A8D8QVS3_9HEMI
MCETPKSSRHLSVSSSSTSNEEFKTVSISATNTPKVLGNMTGMHRIVRDCVADIYNAVQQWNKHFLHGVEILGEIKNIKFDTLDSNEIYSESLQEYCQTLEGVLKSMSSIVNLLSSYLNTMEGLSKLLASEKEILFSTWSFDTFIQTAQFVLNSYQKEFQLKTYIKEHIAHCKDKNSVAFYFIIWVNEAYIGDDLIVQLEAMLVETGHR